MAKSETKTFLMLATCEQCTDGEVVNALGCSPSIHGFNSHSVLLHIGNLIRRIVRRSSPIEYQFLDVQRMCQTITTQITDSGFDPQLITGLYETSFYPALHIARELNIPRALLTFPINVPTFQSACEERGIDRVVLIADKYTPPACTLAARTLQAIKPLQIRTASLITTQKQRPDFYAQILDERAQAVFPWAPHSPHFHELHQAVLNQLGTKHTAAYTPVTA